VSAAHSEFKTPQSAGGIWHSLNRFLFVLIVLTMLAAIVYRMLPEIGKRKEQSARVDELQALVEKEKQTLASNQRIENLLKHDTEYVGLIARDRLDLADPKETIYRLESVKSTH
jgi:cell division protein FtsB